MVDLSNGAYITQMSRIMSAGYSVNERVVDELEAIIPLEIKEQIDALLVFCHLHDAGVIKCNQSFSSASDDFDLLRYDIRLKSGKNTFYNISLTIDYKNKQISNIGEIENSIERLYRGICKEMEGSDCI